MLRCFIVGVQEDWDFYVDSVGSAIRDTEHRLTGFTTKMLMLGREVTQPLDLMFGGGDLSIPEGRSFVQGQGDAMRLAHHLAKENLQKAQRRQKKD